MEAPSISSTINIENVVGELFNNAQYADIVVKVKCGHTWISFFAHKIFLSIWSPVFADLFDGNNSVNNSYYEEGRNVIEIIDVLPESFDLLLRFMYGSSLKLYDNKRNVKLIVNVYKAAEIYQLQELKRLCDEILNSNSANKDNVFELLNAAILINSDCLKSLCFKVLQTETVEVLASQELGNVTSSMITTILSMEVLSLPSEYHLMSWFYKWGEYEYNKEHSLSKECLTITGSYGIPDYKSPMAIMEPFLPKLNFLALEAEDFAKLVRNHEKFFDERECFGIFMNILCSDSWHLPSWCNRSRNSRSFETVSNRGSMGTMKRNDSLQSLERAISIADDIGNTIIAEIVDNSALAIKEGSSNALFLEVSNNSPLADKVDNDNAVAAETDNNSTLANEIDNCSILSVEVNNNSIEVYNDSTLVAEVENGNALAAEVNNDSASATEVDNDSALAIEEDNDSALLAEVDNIVYTTDIAKDSVIANDEVSQVGNNSLDSSITETESNNSWQSLEAPSKCRKKIRKKKVKRYYLLREGKYLPCSLPADDYLFSGSFDLSSLDMMKQFSSIKV